MGMTVRRAVASDVDWILGELRQFAEFTGIAHALIEDEAHAKSLLTSMIANHYFMVAEDGETPAGFIAAYEIPHPFFPKKRLLSETFWWVKPAARGSRAGAMLLNAYIEHGKANADIVTISLEEKSTIKQSTLERRGFRLTERSFIMEVTPQEVA
jgi:ribosomal protein S18 acetylase RimI-like enzyme